MNKPSKSAQTKRKKKKRTLDSYSILITKNEIKDKKRKMHTDREKKRADDKIKD